MPVLHAAVLTMNHNLLESVLPAVIIVMMAMS